MSSMLCGFLKDYLRLSRIRVRQHFSHGSIQNTFTNSEHISLEITIKKSHDFLSIYLTRREAAYRYFWEDVFHCLHRRVWNSHIMVRTTFTLRIGCFTITKYFWRLSDWFRDLNRSIAWLIIIICWWMNWWIYLCLTLKYYTKSDQHRFNCHKIRWRG